MGQGQGFSSIGRWHGIVKLLSQLLGGRRRRIRNSKSFLAAYRVQGQPVLHETLFLNTKTKSRAVRIRVWRDGSVAKNTSCISIRTEVWIQHSCIKLD